MANNIFTSYANPLARSPETIYDAAKNGLAIEAPELAFYEGDFLDHQLEVFAGQAAFLHYYLDKKAQELYLPTLQRFSNAIKIGNDRDYRSKGANPAYALLTFTLSAAATSVVSIPAGVLVATNTNIVFETIEAMEFAINDTEKTVGALQRQKITNDPISSTGLANQKYTLDGLVVDKSVDLQVNGFSWLQVDSFFGYGVDSEVFLCRQNENAEYEIVFGNGLNGKIPDLGATIDVIYYTCSGANGNVARRTINLITTDIALPLGFTITAENPENAINGKGFETLNELRSNIPLFMRSIKGASHRETFPALAQQVNGVASAGVSYDYGAEEIVIEDSLPITKLKPVEIVVVPAQGGEASDLLLEQVRSYVQNRTELEVRVKSTGVVRVLYNVEITVLQLTDETDIKAAVSTALLNFQSTTRQKVNGETVFGEAYYELVIALAPFKTIKKTVIAKIQLVPYPHRQGATTTKLVWKAIIEDTSVGTHRYKIEFTNAVNYILHRDTVLVGTYSIGSTFTNSEITFSISANSYIAGDVYEFLTYEAPRNFEDTLVLNEPSIALSFAEDIAVKVNPLQG
jgi:hypothetical protein